MKKIIKVGFPIVCVAVIGGTFYLLNKTLDRVKENAENENRTANITQNVSNEKNITNTKNTVDTNNIANENKIVNETNTSNKAVLSSTSTVPVEEAGNKVTDNKEKAIELVKKRDGERNKKVYYTHEGMEGKNYIIAVREEDTTEAVIYYSVDTEKEEVKIHY